MVPGEDGRRIELSQFLLNAPKDDEFAELVDERPEYPASSYDILADLLDDGRPWWRSPSRSVA